MAPTRALESRIHRVATNCSPWLELAPASTARELGLMLCRLLERGDGLILTAPTGNLEILPATQWRKLGRRELLLHSGSLSLSETALLNPPDDLAWLVPHLALSYAQSSDVEMAARLVTLATRLAPFHWAVAEVLEYLIEQQDVDGSFGAISLDAGISDNLAEIPASKVRLAIAVLLALAAYVASVRGTSGASGPPGSLVRAPGGPPRNRPRPASTRLRT